MAEDGSFCHVESLVLGTGRLAEILDLALDVAGIDQEAADPDEMGCARRSLAGEVTVTLTSGGNDPTCASDTDAALRFTYGAAE
jgi:hypothetical protein